MSKYGYVATHPHPASVRHRDLVVPSSERFDQMEPENLLAERYGWDCLLRIDGTVSFPTNDGAAAVTTCGYTLTPQADPTGNAMEGTASGLAFKTGATGDDDITFQGARGYTPTTGKVICGHFRFKVDDADKVAIYLGIGATATVPLTTVPTDLLAFRSTTTTSGLLVGGARGNNDTAADSSTLKTVTDGTFVEAKFYCYVHATQPAGIWVVDGTVTPFTAAQLAQVALLLTTPQTVYGQLSARTGEGVSHTLTVDYAYIWGQR